MKLVRLNDPLVHRYILCFLGLSLEYLLLSLFAIAYNKHYGTRRIQYVATTDAACSIYI